MEKGKKEDRNAQEKTMRKNEEIPQVTNERRRSWDKRYVVLYVLVPRYELFLYGKICLFLLVCLYKKNISYKS
jgi:hypothetical protein